MKPLLICIALLLALPASAKTSAIEIYRLELKGPLPPLAQLKTALDPKSMPGLTVYTGRVGKAGDFLIDLTDKSFPAPDPKEKQPRRIGTVVTGAVTAGPDGEPEAQLKLRLRDCRVTAYVHAAGENRFYPEVSESLMELIGRIDASGWSVIDPDPGKGQVRTVIIVRLTGPAA